MKNTHYSITPWSRILLEKLTVHSASQEIPCHLRNQKVHESLPLVPVLSQTIINDYYIFS
jgi:hypothetical protein